MAFVHRYPRADDRELVALVAACIAFGNVKAIRAKLEDLLARLGPHPADAAERRPSPSRAPPRGLEAPRLPRARTSRASSPARAACSASTGRSARASSEPSLGGRADHASLRARPRGAGATPSATQGASRRGGARRGPVASSARPARVRAAASASSSFFAGWCRPADGVDLGLWDVDPARLLVPVDVHIHRLARNSGFTRRRAPSWRTTEEITRALARFDPRIPVKYDFSLCHMGMLQRCPSRRDAEALRGLRRQARVRSLAVSADRPRTG